MSLWALTRPFLARLAAARMGLTTTVSCIVGARQSFITSLSTSEYMVSTLSLTPTATAVSEPGENLVWG